MAVINKSTNKCWQGCGDRGTLLHFWWNADWCSHCGKQYGDTSKKFKWICIWLRNTTSGNISEEPSTLILKNISTSVFSAALFTITKIWKQPKCPSVDEWIKHIWDIYTVEYYLAIKTKKILPFVTVRMDLENIMLNEISQSEKGKYHMTSLIRGI